MADAAAFLALADRQISAPRKALTRAAEKRQREREQQAAMWRHRQAQRSEALLAGPYTAAAHDLIEHLKAMTLKADDPELIGRICSGPWPAADPDTKYTVLALVDGAIAALRERNGLAPFDDALPGEPPTTFQTIREAFA